MPGKPRVIIAGAGFAGLTCARRLKRVDVDVLLVDRNNYHLFTPLLYQVASALLDPGEMARPVRELVRPLRNVEYKQAEVSGADLQRRLLLTDHGPLPYDYLVLATGAETDYFGNESLARHAFGLKGLDEALSLRNRVLGRFEASRWAKTADERRSLLTFAIVGGGPTGVELAGAYAELIRLVLRKDFRDLDLNEVRVLLLEASDKLLAPFEPDLRTAAVRSLESKGVEVMLNARVSEVTKDTVTLADGEQIGASTVVWTAGVKASSSALRSRSSSAGRIASRSTRRCRFPAIPRVCHRRPGGRDRRRRRAADAHPGRHAGGQARGGDDRRPGAQRPTRGLPLQGPGDHGHHRPQLGGGTARPVQLSGFLGWGMWLVVHLVNVISFRSRILVLVNWAWDYLFYDRPVRLIVRAADDPRG